jgi:putative cell wall-binding protein
MLRSRAVLVALVTVNTIVLVAGLLLLLRMPGRSGDGRPIARIQGETSPEIAPMQASNIGISVAMSRAAYPTGPVEAAVIARDDVWVDALSSSTLQGELGAPLLLTGPQSLAPEVLEELQRMQVTTVFLMGGPTAFAPRVGEELVTAGFEVQRVTGDDAVGNAVTIASQLLPEAQTAMLVRGVDASGADRTRGYVDALAAGAWAAAEHMPVLLTDPFQLSTVTRDYLAQSQIRKVVIAGGRVALGGSVIAELERLGVEVERVGGADRFETAAVIAERRGSDPNDPSVLLLDGSGDRMWVAGFAAAVYSMRAAAPILFTSDDEVPEATDAVLKAFPARLVCGPGVTDIACVTARGITPALER